MTKIRIKNRQRRITVNRDKSGIPHIDGATWLDVLYGLGYMHAIDRGTQLLFSRAVAAGQGAERIVDQPELLETDRFFRRIGLHQHLDQEVQSLKDPIFKQITSYCEGVNDGIRASGRSLPMWATGFHPRTWNQEAVLLVGKLISFGGLAVSQMQNERVLLELIQAGANDEALRELLEPRLDGIDFELLRQVKLSSQLSDEALELITDLPRLAGSNAWAVRPQRSATGTAMLASDPHLEVNRLPAIWYEVVLRWGENHGDYLMGATLPGCPLFVAARTRQLAWGVTYMKGDTIDYFIEDCRPGGTTGWQYRRGRRWHDFQVRAEVIERKGNNSQTLQVYFNDLGVLNQEPVPQSPNYQLLVAWTGQKNGAAQGMTTWLEMVQANSTLEAMDIARDCPQPTLCWVFSDGEGHIGLQGCGTFPSRRDGHSGMVPVPAWDTKNHWQGIVPKEALPRIYDPPEGFVATANESVNRPRGPLLVTHPVPDYRRRRIVERLCELTSVTLEDMQKLQYDFVSVQARDMLAVFLPHLDDGELKDKLSRWDCSYAPESREATLFQRFYRNVLMEVFGHAKGIGWRRMLYLCTRAGFSSMILTCADSVLQREQSSWWATRDKRELIRRAAARLRDEKDEPWSQVNSFHFTNRFFGTHQVGRLLGYHSTRQSMPGCHATLFQGHVMQTATRESTFAPSYHFVTDMGKDEAWTNLPGGPSESRFSKFYKNDLELWFNGKYKRLNLKIK